MKSTSWLDRYGTVRKTSSWSRRGGWEKLLLNRKSASCPADLDGSGDVGFEDLTALLSTWGPCTGCAADIDGTGDGLVGFADLVMLLAAWGPC